MKLDHIAKEIRGTLDAKEAVREQALRISRELVRASGAAVHAIHKRQSPAQPLKEAGRLLKKLNAVIEGYPELEHAGYVESAFQEYSEALLFLAISKGRPLPLPSALGITPSAYLLGVGDVIGEVRRLFLDSIIGHDVKRARDLLATMDELYHFLMGFDYPSALSDVRRKQDVARSLLERSRGELAIAVRTTKLERALDAKPE
ncbi:MAG: haloacid dehalogenase [Euryarchaeota archaeon]|nr:haloacid dehalogenase [Euryarchaeota archaeon]